MKRKQPLMTMDLNRCGFDRPVHDPDSITFRGLRQHEIRACGSNDLFLIARLL